MQTKTFDGKRPKTKRGERFLKKKLPKVHENVKSAMFIKGSKTNQIISQVLTDLAALKKPDCKTFRRRCQARPFEDTTEIERLSEKSDCSLFVYGSSSKKRPCNLILGRCFDHRVLDMLELAVENFKPLKDFERVGSFNFEFKPAFVFHGVEFEYQEEFRKFANLLCDIMRGMVVDMVNLEGLDHVFVCTAAEGKIYFRHYAIVLKKSGSNLPRVTLEEIGPSMDLIVRRTQFAPRDLMKQALKLPKEVKSKSKKNRSTTAFGIHGTVHKGRQDLAQLTTKRMKGLKKKRGRGDAAATTTSGAADGQQIPDEAKKEENEEERVAKRVKAG